MEEHGQKYSTADHAQDNADGDFEGGDKHAPCHVANKNKHGPQPSRIRQDFLHGIPPENAHDIGRDLSDEGEVAYLHNRD